MCQSACRWRTRLIRHRAREAFEKLRTRGTAAGDGTMVGFPMPLLIRKRGAAFASNPEVSQRDLGDSNHAVGPGYLRRGGGAQPLRELRQLATASSGRSEAR